MVARPKVRMVVEIDGALYDQFRTLLTSQGVKVRDSVEALIRYYIRLVKEAQKEGESENTTEAGYRDDGD
jgi:hypothetical protein